MTLSCCKENVGSGFEQLIYSFTLIIVLDDYDDDNVETFHTLALKKNIVATLEVASVR